MVSKIEKPYWEARYKQGGTSGQGSIGTGRAWKWKIIREAIRKYSPELLKSKTDHSKPILSKIIDVGCGDLSFWDDESLTILVEEYMGIDISDTVIAKNRKRNVSGWNFIVSSSHILNRGLKASVVFCMDLLFHIMGDMEFIKTLKNLCYYSEDLVFIHTWKYNPFEDGVSDGVYMKYRPLEAYFGIFMGRGFTLMEERLNPNEVGSLYVFKRTQKI